MITGMTTIPASVMLGMPTRYGGARRTPKDVLLILCARIGFNPPGHAVNTKTAGCGRFYSIGARFGAGRQSGVQFSGS